MTLLSTAQSSWATEKPKPAFQSHAAGDDDDDNGAWSTVPKVQHGGMNNGDKAKTTADCLQEEIKNLTVAREVCIVYNSLVFTYLTFLKFIKSPF